MASVDQGGAAESAFLDLDELVLLLSNLDVSVAGRLVQKRRAPDPSTFIGRGKALEMKDFAAHLGAGLLVVDDALSPTQRSNLEKTTGLEVWDRAFTIMRIFERRAVTAEAKLQVELARLRYEIPSLKGLGRQMSRLGGGIGTRGPGETEFERHRRKLERRVKYIEKSLQGVRKRRDLHRYRRARDGARLVSLVGYTNSGKSTLLRSLTKDGSIRVEDRLFSTLDTLTKRVSCPSAVPFLMSDTVGFIKKLPPELVAAFRSTLEEASSADLLLVVTDASSQVPLENFEVVLETLKDIGADEIPRFVVLNKIDRVSEELLFVAAGFESRGEDVIRVSALTAEGLPELVRRICERLDETR
ncbi:MAG: GTPase HflX [Synergistaceae bacterium]|nr:GTPase HflX [Synergistaceae bacterium]